MYMMYVNLKLIVQQKIKLFVALLILSQPWIIMIRLLHVHDVPVHYMYNVLDLC